MTVAQRMARLREWADPNLRDRRVRAVRAAVQQPEARERMRAAAIERSGRFIQTEIGLECRCARCGDYWPADSEFFHLTPRGLPHSYCKACFVEYQVERGTRTGTGTNYADHVKESS
jgi:hypothetical protein